MKKHIFSIFLALILCVNFSIPAFASDYSNLQDTYYIQQIDGVYKAVSTSFKTIQDGGIDNAYTIAVTLNNTGIIYQSNDGRYFYTDDGETFLETNKVEISADCVLSIKEIESDYHLSEAVATRVYELLHNSPANGKPVGHIVVYPNLIAQSRSASADNYTKYTYKNDLVSWHTESGFLPMFSSEEESLASMRSKKISIVISWLASALTGIIDKGLYSFAAMGIDVASQGIVSDFHSWKHEVKLRADITEKLTSILYGGEYMYGARTASIAYDFAERFAKGVGNTDDYQYSRVFSDKTPSFDNPKELCYLNFLNGGESENFKNIQHGFITFGIS